MKCSKNYNACAKPLHYSLNLLFSNVPIAVAVVVFLNSLLTDKSNHKLYTVTVRSNHNTNMTYFTDGRVGLDDFLFR